MLLEQAEVRDASGELELAELGSGHCHVDAEETRGEDEEDAEGDREFPSAKREPIEFRSLSGG